MSRYKRGDVVRVQFSYYNHQKGCFEEKARPFIVIDVIDGTDNITVSGTGRLYQAKKHAGIIVKLDSPEGLEMGIDKDTFFYCDATVTLQNKDIRRRIGDCPQIKEVLRLLNYPEDDF